MDFSEQDIELWEHVSMAALRLAHAQEPTIHPKAIADDAIKHLSSQFIRLAAIYYLRQIATGVICGDDFIAEAKRLRERA